MNPWGFLVIGLGILLVIIGVKGSYENVVGALTHHANRIKPNPPSDTGTIQAQTLPYYTQQGPFGRQPGTPTPRPIMV